MITDVDGAVSRPMYKLLGVDLGLSSGSNGYITLRKFDFISRNQNVLLTSQANGLTDIRYRVMGSTIQFTPSPASGQRIRLQYIPRMTRLLKDTDRADGVSGWTEYIIVDAAIKILLKEESDVSALMAVKQGLIDRIQVASQNRDAGAPDTISDIRRIGRHSDDGWQ